MRKYLEIIFEKGLTIVMFYGTIIKELALTNVRFLLMVGNDKNDFGGVYDV